MSFSIELQIFDLQGNLTNTLIPEKIFIRETKSFDCSFIIQNNNLYLSYSDYGLNCLHFVLNTESGTLDYVTTHKNLRTLMYN